MITAKYKIAGVRLDVESDRDEVPFQQLRRDLALMEGAFDDPPELRLILRIRSMHEPSPVKLPASARMIRVGSRKVFEDHGRWFVDLDEVAFFAIDGFSIEGVCYFYPELDPFFWTEICFSYIVSILMRRKKRYFLHAGGAEFNGKGRFFTGASGFGKSTAALKLGQAGWNYFADDMVFVDDRLRIYPFPKRGSATEWTVKRLGLESRVVQKKGTGKSVIRPWSSATEFVTEYDLFYPLAAVEKSNRIAQLSEDEAVEILRSQMTFCHTDQIMGGPLPDLRPLAQKLREIRIGDLDSLPEFLTTI